MLWKEAELQNYTNNGSLKDNGLPAAPSRGGSARGEHGPSRASVCLPGTPGPPNRRVLEIKRRDPCSQNKCSDTQRINEISNSLSDCVSKKNQLQLNTERQSN